MICNLFFSCLDFGYSSLWLGLGLIVFFFFFFSFNSCQWLVMYESGLVKEVGLDLIGSTVIGSVLLNNRFGFSVSLFLLMLVLNIFSLMPYVYGLLSLGQVVVFSGLVVWLISIFIGVYEKFIFFFIHLVPEGVPLVLSFPMVVIEFVSLIIRPVTLSVRLLANISVGHLLLSLSGMFGLIISFGSIIGFLVVSLLCLLEMVTAFMQAYVFVLLGWVYIMEN